jgi:hypothetical protein
VSGFFQSAQNVWAEMKTFFACLYWVTKIIRQHKHSQNVQYILPSGFFPESTQIFLGRNENFQPI